MDYGKVVFNPGHINGANVDPAFPDYSEGTQMYNLGLILNSATGAPLTRGPNEKPELYERARRAKALGANTYISLHTNYPTHGVIVYYSVRRPEDRELAEAVGSQVAQVMGINFRGAETKLYPDTDDTDYYGDVRYAVREGIEHVLLVEHGAHAEMAIDTEAKLQAIARVYESILFNKGVDDVKGIILVYGDADWDAAKGAHNITGFPITTEEAYAAAPFNAGVRIHVGGPDRPNTPTDVYCAGATRIETLVDMLRELHII
jgi:hypothetical protein